MARRLLLLLGLVTASQGTISRPEQCGLATGSEFEYYCQVGSGHVKFSTSMNQYVNVECEGTNFTCADLPSLDLASNQLLTSLSVESCSSGVLACLPKVINAPSVKYVYIKKATTPLQPEHVRPLRDVQELMIEEGPEKKIPIPAIKELPSLKYLHIKGTQISLDSHTFPNDTNLEYLELSTGKGIKDIPDDAFNGLGKLRTLNVWGNYFNSLGVNSLRGLHSLRRLDLAINRNLSTIPAGAFSHTPNLQTITLLKNPIKDLPEGLLYNLTQLENITIRMNEVHLKLHPRSFSNLPSLKNLIITDTAIELTEDLITGCESLQTLDLSKDGIPSVPDKFFKDLQNLEVLNLSQNRISYLNASVFLTLKKLRHLNLNRNHLETLPDFLFAGLRHLHYVSIDYNLLTEIGLYTFQGTEELATLSLVANRLTFEPTKENLYWSFDGPSPFNALGSLKYLYLNSNYIKNILTDWRMLTNLEVLNLSYNKIMLLVATDCQFLSGNIKVDLRHNDISTVALKRANMPNDTDTDRQINSTILLDYNPLKCDCQSYNLALRLRGTRPETVEPKFIVSNARCSSPNHLKGELFKSVSLYDLNCDFDEQCPELCDCQMRPAYKDLAFDCQSVPKFDLDPKKFGLQGISLKLNTVPQYIGNLSLKLLNLSNIGMTEIPFQPSKMVEAIDFSNNNLTKIPTEFLKWNTTLNLSKNPFDCQCWDEEDISLLRQSLTVKDLASVTCSDGQKIMQLDLNALCSTWRAAKVGVGTFVALALVLIFLIVFLYRNYRKIQLFAINKGLCPCFFIDDLEDADKIYDVFVSFAHKDRKYLETLMPMLENDFGLKACVHYRDWPIGDLIPDQINRSVENSRKTIILLSNNAIESGYANMEFQSANTHALKVGKNKIILILLEDENNLKNVSEELANYLKMNTFLKWSDPRFRERLHRALPLKGNKKFVWPDVFKQAKEKGVLSGLDVHLNIDGQLVNLAVKDV